jgi:hypothetical protein
MSLGLTVSDYTALKNLAIVNLLSAWVSSRLYLQVALGAGPSSMVFSGSQGLARPERLKSKERSRGLQQQATLARILHDNPRMM